MARVTKVIGGRAYYYSQTSKRVNGKVVTKSEYIGPVVMRRPGPPRRITVFSFLGQLLRGGVEIGAGAMAGKLGRPNYKAKKHENGREINKLRDAVKKLDYEFGVDRSTPKAWNETRVRLSPELFQEFSKREMGLRRDHSAQKHQKEAKPITESARQFNEKIAAVQAEQTAKAAEQPTEQPDAAPTGGDGSDPSPLS